MIRTVFDNGTLVWTGDETASLVAAAPDFFKFDNRINAFRSRACDYASILQKVRSLQLPFTDEACAFEPIRNLALQETLIPRPHQQTAFDAWRKNGYRGVAALPTGSGKTILAVMAIARLKRPALVLVPTIDLLAQWTNVSNSCFLNCIFWNFIDI